MMICPDDRPVWLFLFSSLNWGGGSHRVFKKRVLRSNFQQSSAFRQAKNKSRPAFHTGKKGSMASLIPCAVAIGPTCSGTLACKARVGGAR
jgi:hypothetical protein